jgi:hypothetical protein
MAEEQKWHPALRVTKRGFVSNILAGFASIGFVCDCDVVEGWADFIWRDVA